MRILIAVLSNRDHHPLFTSCLIDMAIYTAMNAVKIGIETIGTKITWGCSHLPQARQSMVEYAQANNFTHLLWIDDDSIFPIDSLERLISRRVSAIGANFVQKKSNEKIFTAIALDLCSRVDSTNKTGIEEIGQLGFGIYLLDLKCLDGIEQPFFQSPYNEETGNITSEDCYFSRKLLAHNVNLYVDHDLSQKVGHIGPFVYTLHSYA